MRVVHGSLAPAVGRCGGVVVVLLLPPSSSSSLSLLLLLCEVASPLRGNGIATRGGHCRVHHTRGPDERILHVHLTRFQGHDFATRRRVVVSVVDADSTQEEIILLLLLLFVNGIKTPQTGQPKEQEDEFSHAPSSG